MTTPLLDGNDEVDPRMDRVVQTLGRKLEKFRGVFITERVVREVDHIVKDHRATWRLRGVAVPPLAAVVLPQTGWIEVLRGDLDAKGVQSAVLGLKARFPKITVEELAVAFHRVFPGYAPKLKESV